jgi:hypothetical protein
MKIDIILPADRTKTGTLTLYGQDGHIIAGPYTVQGKGTSNAGPLAPNGDTPTGDYVLPNQPFMGPGTTANDIKRFGTHSRIIISPVSGDAAAAVPTREMDTIRIHGGSPSAAGGLRWTQGCLRLSNDNMLGLLDGLIIGALEATNLTVATGTSTDMALPSVDVSVSEEDIDPPQDTPDPQPTRSPAEAQPPKTGKETKEGKDTKEGSEGKETKEGSEGSESKEESDGKEGESDGSEDSENKEGESDGSEDSENKEGESDGSEGSEGKEESEGKEGESDGSEDSEGKEGFDGPPMG